VDDRTGGEGQREVERVESPVDDERADQEEEEERESEVADVCAATDGTNTFWHPM
jgi:hypothetical protein